jgi:hypothetical protein
VRPGILFELILVCLFLQSQNKPYKSWIMGIICYSYAKYEPEISKPRQADHYKKGCLSKTRATKRTTKYKGTPLLHSIVLLRLHGQPCITKRFIINMCKPLCPIQNRSNDVEPSENNLWDLVHKFTPVDQLQQLTRC